MWPSPSPYAQQFPDDPILVGGWPLDDDAPIHPGGMKPKRVFICPDYVSQPYLIRGQRYLFKEGEGFRAQQLWSEVVAYHLAQAIGAHVPPAFVAFDEKRGKAGVLIEFFFGHPTEWPPRRFVHAIERMQGIGMAVDLGRGSLVDNLTLCRRHSVPDRIAWWAEAVAFDSLIGNTDRQSENCGVLRQTGDPGDPEYRMAPVFDNGTSLGFQIGDDQLARFTKSMELARFVARGSHHFGWSAGDDGKLPHSELCARLVAAHPAARVTMERVIALRDSDIGDTLQWCTKFNLDIRFSPDRAEFVRRQLEVRRAAVMAAIGA